MEFKKDKLVVKFLENRDLMGEVAAHPRASYPRLVAEKGRNPEQFANKYEDFDQYAEPSDDSVEEDSFMDDELPEGEE